MTGTSEERRATIYASTGGTETNALQVTLCQGHGRAHHLTIEQCYEDLEPGRLAFQRSAHRHEFAVVFVTTPDRLATSEDDQKTYLFRHYFSRRKGNQKTYLFR